MVAYSSACDYQLKVNYRLSIPIRFDAMVDEHTQKILNFQFNSLIKCYNFPISPSLPGIALVWESYKLDPYVQKLAEGVLNLQEKVDDLMAIEERIDVEVGGFLFVTILLN